MFKKLKALFGRFRKGKETIEKIDAQQNVYVFTREDKARAGFAAPTYTQSRHVELDRQLLADNRCVSIFPGTQENEQYKVLRTQILHYAREKGGNTIMITSAQPGEGKTLTAINLAFTFAKQFEQTVLLVDCDLRKQGIRKVLGFNNDKGLLDYLIDNEPLSDLMVWPGIDKLTLISGGRIVEESTELLGSPRMKDLVREMKTRYSDRFVFFDVPPVLAGADALAFAPLVDFIIIVVHAGTTTINDVQKTLELIPNEKVLGFVLNRHTMPSKPYSVKMQQH